jgi:hypothetical protein
MRTLVSLTETFGFFVGFKTVFMVGSENVGKGEIQERKRPLCISRVRFGALLVWKFLRINLVWKGLAERPNPFIFNLACNLVWNFVRDLARNLVWNFCRKTESLRFYFLMPNFRIPGLTTLLSSGNTPGIDQGALVKIQNPWRQIRRFITAVPYL